MVSVWTSILFAVPGVALGAVALLYKRGPVARSISVMTFLFIYAVTGYLLSFTRQESMMDIEMTGLAFPIPLAASDRKTISIGGSLEKDDIYVPEFRERAFELKVEKSKTAVLGQGAPSNRKKEFPDEQIVLRRSEPTETNPMHREVITIGDTLVGLVPLRDGTRVSIARPKSTVSELVFYQPKTKLGALAELRSSSGSLKLENRRIQIPLTGKQITLPGFANRRVEPLVLPAPVPDAVAPQPDVPARTRDPLGLRGGDSALITGVSNPNDGSRDFNRVGLLVMDDYVTVIPKGSSSVASPWINPVPISQGDALTFSQISESPGRQIVPRLKFRSVKIVQGKKNEPRYLELLYARPRRKQVKVSGDGSAVVLQSRLLARDGEQVIRFTELSQSASRSGARLILKPESFAMQTAFKKETERSYRGDILLGESHGVKFRLRRQDWPWHLWGALTATVAGILIFSGRGLTDRGFFCIMGGASVLTCARLVCAYAASERPPFETEATVLAVYALGLVPATILVLARTADWLEHRGMIKGRDSRARGGLSRLSDSGRHAFGGCTIILAASFAAAPMFEVSQVRGLAALLPFAGLILLVLWSTLGPGSRQKWNRLRSGITQSMGYGPLWLILACLYGGRIVLVLMGQKEQLDFGIRVPLALIYVPAFVLLFALACAQYWRETRIAPPDGKSLRRFVVFAGALMLLHLGINGILVSDLGMAIYVLPASLLLVMIAIQAFPRVTFTQHAWTWLSISILPFCLAVSFLAAPRAAIETAAFIFDQEIIGDKLRDPDDLITEPQLLRLLQFIDRQKLVSLGTRASEAIAQHLAVMDDYTSRGLFGEGLFKVPVVSAVRETCLSDNVAAVYLLGQFGAVGILGVLAACCVLATACLTLPTNVLDERWAWRCFGWCLTALCGGTLALTGIYMIAANCQLAPFTGRNIYLLGLNSLGDVWESCLLLGLMITGLRIRDEFSS